MDPVRPPERLGNTYETVETVRLKGLATKKNIAARRRKSNVHTNVKLCSMVDSVFEGLECCSEHRYADPEPLEQIYFTYTWSQRFIEVIVASPF